jgi:hypothetical protein
MILPTVGNIINRPFYRHHLSSHQARAITRCHHNHLEFKSTCSRDGTAAAVNLTAVIQPPKPPPYTPPYTLIALKLQLTPLENENGE